VAFAAIPVEERGDGTTATYFEDGEPVDTIEVPLPGRHNLSNTLAALAACRLEGVPLEDLKRGLAELQPPGRRFDCRGVWQGRAIVDDYAHHPSEVAATLAMARLMVESGRSPLPIRPRRLVAVFQPHRFTRTAQFLDDFAAALTRADAVILAPLYAAGEAPLAGISSPALGEALGRLRPDLPLAVAATMEELTEQVAARSGPGDLVLAMGAGDVNSLWDRLRVLEDRDRPAFLVA
jgi:UDP-N-acetylmuramate--alanine ligase